MSERVAGRLPSALVISTSAERFRFATPTLEAGTPFICSSAPRFVRLQLCGAKELVRSEHNLSRRGLFFKAWVFAAAHILLLLRNGVAIHVHRARFTLIWGPKELMEFTELRFHEGCTELSSGGGERGEWFVFSKVNL